MTSIESTYRARFARSVAMFAEAQGRFPGGITHDGRHAMPFPLFIERADGAYTWGVDDNRMIDYWCGHGSLLLGHGHPAVVAAVQAQVALGTHYGAGHALELRWAALVQQLVPGAERVRFTASGTEASMLAIRLARAATGRPMIVRFAGHFHGWHDGIAPGADPEDPHAGLPADVLGHVLTLPPDADALEAALAARDDIAAVIMEPTGASYGTIPLADSFLRAARALTARHDALLICDEVVTGFRLSPGGAQARAGVTADLTCLAKVLAGGLPGGAVAGREPIMRHLAFGDAAWNRTQKIRHQGTYNANPLSAAAGVAALELVSTGAPGEAAAQSGAALRAAMNDVLRARGLRGWTVYGDSSIFHLFADPAAPVEPGQIPEGVPVAALKRGGDPQITGPLRMALQIEGVNLMRGRCGFVSAAHGAAQVSATAAALDAAIGRMIADGMTELSA
ncbi:aminotransferase class III-fold pyridoxal phosphate-dependent enzyme [Oscillochloris sp. ZM17-4]|uniref:aspartate aminotransferase family protein n=1 Tax=Oscillochloris sp. ZM17-4 TaxID=2866714 RepID=UPI001C738E2D|nr:aminotransferase class III-fold pyridoxal phosphate-dependent enzyme [Oscillochloris sp. ZM17-4]MBX0326433.1 aminotransferase class III-fold pyridoxal phosphate-dependent enzyme [Oscillochloris sp. ZM17-4]